MRWFPGDDLLATLRLTVHPEAQVTPVQHGIPWLGFVVYPAYRPGEGPQCPALSPSAAGALAGVLRWRHQFCRI